MQHTYARNLWVKPFGIFHVLSLMLLWTNAPPVFAQAPTTPKIALSATPNGDWDILLMNPDGSEQINLTNDAALDYYPAWSPTGEQILFSSDRDISPGSLDLYLMDPDGSNVRRVFGKSKDRGAPAWSPDGKLIAYCSREQGQLVLYIGTIDGKKEERITFGCGPAWSPDGREIAFTSGWPKDMRINILNVETGRSKFFFPPKAQPSWMEKISWSPSGDKLAFSWLHRVPLKDFLETQTIYTVNRDGGDLKQIVPEAGLRAVKPMWSPDGSVLFYQQLVMDKALGKKRWQIFKVAAMGGEPVEVGPPGWYSLGDWFDPAYALPVSPQPHLLTTTWGEVKRQ